MNLEELAQREIAKRQSAAQKTREDFPICTAMLEPFTRDFGPLRVKYLSENGKTLGRLRPEGEI